MNSAFLIETPSLLLRCFVSGDVPSVFALSREPCALRWLPSQVCQDEEEARVLIESLQEQFDLSATPLTNAFVLGVVAKSSQRLIGHVGLSPLWDKVEVGFGIETASH